MLTDVLVTLWRRRLLVILATVVALLAGVGSFMAIKPQQEAKATLLLLTSTKQPGVQGPTNPFMMFGGTLAITSVALQTIANGEQMAAAVAEAGGHAAYTVSPNYAENSGPTMMLAAKSVSPQDAQNTLDILIRQLQDALRKVQLDNGVEPDLLITAQVLVQDAKPKPIRKAQMQTALMAGVGTWGLLCGLILLLERRRTRRSGTSPVPPGNNDAPTPAPPAPDAEPAQATSSEAARPKPGKRARETAEARDGAVSRVGTRDRIERASLALQQARQSDNKSQHEQ